MSALKVSNFGLDRGYRQIGVNVSKGFFGLSGVWTLSNIKRVGVKPAFCGSNKRRALQDRT